ncbi:hypothetical protein CC85DRAFT_167573 [Cutaneotrichosporon oleaginosum]|uniref:Uncharacterized protein n=1 Tax=Cutaneotrichosporon oleaginosum TaxID=879819 RepID=A0A0J0XFS8_9TREE|nr:uncharacterized protein CC85DRAFT_167573 [Cutaneotrichosporon oleaginosum]KLT39928.1 hypothetical protein CC85DRAFT_167573 [Cutaneotrichosporon oleaginosum]TXT08342.1 hypothetical protein COLE_05266 [Cutaneotrichosporon oleaginosum]
MRPSGATGANFPTTRSSAFKRDQAAPRFLLVYINCILLGTSSKRRSCETAYSMPKSCAVLGCGDKPRPCFGRAQLTQPRRRSGVIGGIGACELDVSDPSVRSRFLLSGLSLLSLLSTCSSIFSLCCPSVTVSRFPVSNIISFPLPLLLSHTPPSVPLPVLTLPLATSQLPTPSHATGTEHCTVSFPRITYTP